MVSKLAAFLLNHLSENDLIAAAASDDVKKDQGQHCEVWYFVGMKRLLAEDRKTAFDDFQKCVATGETDYCEYILAEAELQALQPPDKN
jgi:lipoprotein NlpI